MPKKNWMKLAFKCAEKSNHGRSKHGAVLVKGGSIVNIAKNSNNYTSFGQRFRKYDNPYKATHHAEIACILGLDKSITKGATIYVARVSKAGEPRNSKPCELCQSVLKHVGVKKAIYSTNDGYGIMKL